MVDHSNAAAKIRLDKWLWYARVVKTRSLAQKLIAAGKVRVDRQKVTSASFALTIGHTLTITLERDVLVYEVQELGNRRGPYSEAQLLYKNLTPPKEKQPEKPFETSTPAAEKRPDKRQRRKLIALKESNSGF